MKLSILVVTLAMLLQACGTQNKIKKANRSIELFNTQTQKESAGLATLKEQVSQKSIAKSIDSSSNGKLMTRIHSLEERIDTTKRKTDIIRDMMQVKRAFRKSYKTKLLPLLVEIDTFNNQSGKRERLYAMLRDAVNTANYNLFNFAAFFDPGVYRIPPEGNANVNTMFAPVIDSIIAFSNRYDDIPHTASIVLLGYADGLGIGDSTELYTTLSEMLKDTMPSRAAMNRQLSQLRAQALQTQLKQMMITKASSFTHFNNVRLGYIAQGRGEEYPLPQIKDYMEDDERRRIVLCYWTIIPEF